MNTAPIVSRVWSFCTTLRDDGVSYGDYLEQLTYLIFLKMADEYGKPPYDRDVGIPAEYGWQSLRAKRGADLEAHYVTLLRELGTRRGMLGQIFTKAQNKIQDPAKLYRLIDMVDDTDWITLGADVKGDIYEGLLEKNAEDTKSGAGQYFTPRALIRAMVECVRPAPGKRTSRTRRAVPAGSSWAPTTSSPTPSTSRSTAIRRRFSSTTRSTATRSSPTPGVCA